MAALSTFGRDLTEKADRGYKELLGSVPTPKDAKLRWHLVDNILPGLAIYRALRDSGLAEKAALEAIDRCFFEVSEDSRRKLERIGGLPFAYGLLRLLVRPAMRAYPPSGWDIVWHEVGRERIRFDMKSCYYHDSLKRLGAPELCAAYCRIDDLVYGGEGKRYAWLRSKTIARGDEFCDFHFARPGQRA